MTTWQEVHDAITDDLPDRYIDWIDRDALALAVMRRFEPPEIRIHE